MYKVLLFFSFLCVNIFSQGEKAKSLLGAPAFIKKGEAYEFALGSSLPLEGGVNTIGKDFSNGLNMAFTIFNRGVGQHKKMVRLFSLDDRYSQTQGYQNIMLLQKKNINILTGILQDKVIDLYDTSLLEGSLGIWFGLSGAKDLYEKKYPLTINFRPSLQREIEGLTSYVVKNRLLENIVVFYEDSMWGKDGLKYVEKNLKDMNIELRNAFSYPINTVHIKDVVSSIVRVQPTAIICIAHARPTYTVIQEVLSAGLEHCQFFGVSTVAPIQYLLKKSRGIDITYSSGFPDPFLSNKEIVKKYREDMQKYFPYVEFSPYSLEGYVVGKLLLHVLKKVPVNSTFAGVLEEFKKIKQAAFGGIDCHFSDEKRSFSSAVWIKEMPETESVQILS